MVCEGLFKSDELVPDLNVNSVFIDLFFCP